MIWNRHELILVHCDSAFCQNLEGMVSWYTWWKVIFLRNYLTTSNGIFCKMQVISCSSYPEIILRFILYFENHWCGKSDCNYFWDIRYSIRNKCKGRWSFFICRWDALSWYWWVSTFPSLYTAYAHLFGPALTYWKYIMIYIVSFCFH